MGCPVVEDAIPTDEGRALEDGVLPDGVRAPEDHLPVRVGAVEPLDFENARGDPKRAERDV